MSLVSTTIDPNGIATLTLCDEANLNAMSEEMAKAEVVQAFADARAAWCSGPIGAGQVLSFGPQGWLGIAHHHPRQARLEHGQVVEAVTGGDHESRVDLQGFQQGHQGAALVHPGRKQIEIAVVGQQAIDAMGLQLGDVDLMSRDSVRTLSQMRAESGV